MDLHLAKDTGSCQSAQPHHLNERQVHKTWQRLLCRPWGCTEVPPSFPDFIQNIWGTWRYRFLFGIFSNNARKLLVPEETSLVLRHAELGAHMDHLVLSKLLVFSFQLSVPQAGCLQGADQRPGSAICQLSATLHTSLNTLRPFVRLFHALVFVNPAT